MDMPKTQIESTSSRKEATLDPILTKGKRINPFKIISAPQTQVLKKQDLRGKMIRKMKYKGKNNGKWSGEEQNRFLTAVKLFGTYWPALQVFIPTRTSGQIRSHAQKYFLGQKRIEFLKLRQQGSLKKIKFFVFKNYRNWDYNGKFTQEKYDQICQLKEKYFPEHSEPNFWEMERPAQLSMESRLTDPALLIKEDASLVKLDSFPSPTHSLSLEEAPFEFKIENEGYFDKDIFAFGEQELSIRKNPNFSDEEIAFFNGEDYQYKEELHEEFLLNDQELI